MLKKKKENKKKIKIKRYPLKIIISKIEKT